MGRAPRPEEPVAHRETYQTPDKSPSEQYKEGSDLLR